MTKAEYRKKQKHNGYMKEWNKHSESYKEYQKEYHKGHREKNKGYYYISLLIKMEK